MKKKKRFQMGLLAAIVALTGCSSSNKEQVGAEAEQSNRVVAISTAVVDIMDRLEIDLVGIPSTKKEIPERYNGVTEVGNAMSPDLEIIKSLNPDTVYSVTTLESDLSESFTNAEIEANFLDLQSIDSMQDEILELGEKYDRQQQAGELVSEMDQQLQEITQKVKDYESPRVLILFGVPGSYLVATENSYIGNLVEICGGVNAVEGQSVEYLASNTEYLQESNPDIILRMAHGMPDEVVKMFDEEFKTNDIWQHFDAVKNGRVYDLDESLFASTANLQVCDALNELMAIFYGEEE